MLPAIRYSFFTVLASITNILCQHVVGRLYIGRFVLQTSMLAGTLTGLALKYILDKMYIFGVPSRSLLHDGRKFILCSFVGVFTTCVFWGVATTFDYAFRTLLMRYTGAVLGLGTGYFLKYRLDWRFVFVDRPEKLQPAE